MADYIKREDALEQFDYYDLDEYLTPQIRGMLMDIPSADVAPVVRCKDCVHCEKETMTCTIFIKNRLGDDFCSEGER